MTTSQSPLRVLKAQADNIARIVKAVERGENPLDDRGGKIAAARNRDTVKFGVVMDDKLIMIDMAWATIREMSEVGIAEYILKYMRGARETQH
ncbi:hypothetical protein ACRQ5Q_17065 [Bradyrhizobium sp. PMVTL-01]|uniref:hypothetical protein n=1 Tax=Bradyrhizobium sp. PMVTL-01 TaxID=3434999 RepID=UPI003F6FC1EC